jgi:uncharacterized protein (DUF58 family)
VRRRRGERWRRFYRESLTPSGRALLLGTLATALLGVNTFHSQVYVTFATATGLLVAALAASVAARPQVEVRGHLPRRTAAGETLTWRVRVTARRQVDDLQVRPHHLPEHVSVSRDPGASGLPCLAAGSSADFLLPLSFERRGAYDLPGVQVTSTHPLGLVHNGGVHAIAARVLVHPRFPRLDRLSLPLTARLHPGGMALAHSTGESTEFVATREFRQGDPLRKLHARSWARRGEPVVRVDQEEFFARLALVVDTRDPGGRAHRLERAASAAAAVTDWVVRQQYLIDLVAAGPDLYFLTAGRGVAHLEQVLDILACLEATRSDCLARIAPEFFDRLAQISTALLVLLDWDKARQRFVEKIRHRGIGMRIILLGSPAQDPPEDAILIQDREDLGLALEAIP